MSQPTNVNWKRVAKLKSLRFWNQFGSQMRNGAGFSKESKIAALIEISEANTSYEGQSTAAERRADFDNRKRRIHPLTSHDFGKCFACGAPATCRHHLVQIQNGGINDRKNIASLCDACHAAIHPWLDA